MGKSVPPPHLGGGGEKEASPQYVTTETSHYFTTEAPQYATVPSQSVTTEVPQSVQSVPECVLPSPSPHRHTPLGCLTRRKWAGSNF